MKEIVDDFCIGEETNMFLGILGEHGFWHTLIVHGKEIFEVRKEPLKLIDHWLLQNGSSYEGALKAAKFHIGAGYMLPIALNLHNKRIIIFPSESPNNCTCVWFVLHNVAESFRINKYQTDIVFTNGMRYALKMKEKQFKNKKIIAAEYRDKLMRCNSVEEIIKNSACDYSIIKEMNRVYTVFHPSENLDRK